MGTLKVKNLIVRSNVGFDPHVSDYRQDLVVNLSINYNSFVEEESDNPADAFQVNKLIKEIMGRADNSHFNLLEAFTRMLLNTILEFPRVESVEIEAKTEQSVRFPGEMSFVLSGSNR
ncbi:dihydroneopterin aldolase [Labilibacter marinus]|uniref:dihydroneopterin aldolase n=1 Tax=Labilibacter marinus TaxID=1477105 RepID=UPI00094FDCFA|nr:dihydroneopterin aldolase [Labilibacter marinus]